MNQKIASFVKFFCVTYLIFVIPKVISYYSSLHKKPPEQRLNILLGVENFVYNSAKYKHYKDVCFGLIHNDRSLDQFGSRSIDLLSRKGFNIKQSCALDEKRLKKLKAVITKDFKQVDAVLVDIQNSGVQTGFIVTFLSRLFSLCRGCNKKVVVLDRPNPLGGVMEGPGDIPWRHGLTIGELSLYINKHVVEKPVDLSVIPLRGWRRTRKVAGLNTFHIPSFLAPIESLRPLKVAPCLHSDFYAISMDKKHKLSKWESRYFKRLCWNAGLHCLDHTKMGEEGLKVALKHDINNFSAFNSLLTISRFLNNRKQINLSFGKKFDTLSGSPLLRRLLQGKMSFDDFKTRIEDSVLSFYDTSKYCCLYKPLPHIIKPNIIKLK